MGLTVAVIGAARKSNGIGRFISKYCHQNGARVAAVMGTTAASAAKAAAGLQEYGIQARPYSCLQQMLDKEQPRAVVIASPLATHEMYLQQSLANGVHVFCEKPFVHIQGNAAQLQSRLCDLLAAAAAQNLRLAMNAQWPFSLPGYEALFGPVRYMACHTFYMRLSPVVAGKAVLLDSMPHALSLLYQVLGPGAIKQLRFQPQTESHWGLRVEFDYSWAGGCCCCCVDMVQTLEQPRPLAYGFDGCIASRALDMETYSIYFQTEDKRVHVTDPLQLAVADFLAAVKNSREPTIGPGHIRSNTLLLKQLYDAYA